MKNILFILLFIPLISFGQRVIPFDYSADYRKNIQVRDTAKLDKILFEDGSIQTSSYRKDSVAVQIHDSINNLNLGEPIYETDSAYIKENIRSIINVINYNAVGDGVTINNTAFQNAINACSTGGTLIIPSGTYVLQKFTLTKRVNFLGMGGIIKLVDNDTLIKVQVNDISFQNLTFIGDSASNGQIGFYINNAFRITFNNCNILNFRKYGIYSLNNALYGGITCLNTIFKGNSIGCFLGERGEYSLFNGCFFVTNTTGLQINGGNNAVIGCKILTNTNGIQIGYGTNNSHGSIIGCDINHNSGYALKIDSIQLGESIEGCHIYDGTILIKNSNNVKINGGTLAPSNLLFENAVNCVISDADIDNTYSITINQSYNNQPSSVFWKNNIAKNGTYIRSDYAPYEIIEREQTGTTIDYGLSPKQYRELTGDVVITSIDNVTLNKMRLIVKGNGHNYTIPSGYNLTGTYEADSVNVFDFDALAIGRFPIVSCNIWQPVIAKDSSQINVTWIYPNSNLSVSSNSITKISGNVANWDAWATNSTKIYGNGNIQWKIGTITSAGYFVGFTTGNPLQSGFVHMKFALAIIAGNVYKYENGTSGGLITTVNLNDLLRIRITGGTIVTYEKSTNNGVNWSVINTSAQAATFPLKTAINIKDYITISEVKMSGIMGNYTDNINYE